MIKYFAVVQYPTLPHGGIIDVISEYIAAVPVNTTTTIIVVFTSKRKQWVRDSEHLNTITKQSSVNAVDTRWWPEPS